jgi:hypothetical protein
MALEKAWGLVPPQPFTTDGTQLGKITVANTAGFKVKQAAYLIADTLPALPVQIKRVLSPTTLIVGTINNAQIASWPPLNISAYTVALNAAIGAQIQPKNEPTVDDIFKAVYESDPTVALRVIFTDQYGNLYSDENPLPATFTGSITIGAVEVKGSTGNIIEPNVDGSLNVDVLNDITIAGGEIEVVGPTGNILNPNPDGSINVVVSSAPSTTSTVKNTYNSVTSVVSGALTTIVMYTVPPATQAVLQIIEYSGDNIAKYDVLINSNPEATRRTMFGADLTGMFDFRSGNDSGLLLSAGDVVIMEVLHNRPDVGNFEARIQVLEIP